MALHSVPKPASLTESRLDVAKRRMRAAPKPESMLQCASCGCRELIETKIGVMLLNGKQYGGTKSLVCASCQREGRRVVVL